MVDSRAVSSPSQGEEKSSLKNLAIEFKTLEGGLREPQDQLNILSSVRLRNFRQQQPIHFVTRTYIFTGDSTWFGRGGNRENSIVASQRSKVIIRVF